MDSLQVPPLAFALACAKAGLWEKALDLLKEMEEEGIAPTGVIYSVTITACGNGGQWQKALDLLDLVGALINSKCAFTLIYRFADLSFLRLRRCKKKG